MRTRFSHSRPARSPLVVEALEDRLAPALLAMPSAADGNPIKGSFVAVQAAGTASPAAPSSSPPPASAPTPPSMFQAWVSLYTDGALLEATYQGNIDGFKATPQSLAIAQELNALLTYFGNPSPSAIEANIAFNLTYAGPFGPYLVDAGEIALYQALPQPSSS